MMSQVIKGIPWWLEFCHSTAGGTGLIPDQGTEILSVTLHSPKKKKKVIVKIHLEVNSIVSSRQKFD